MELRNSIDFLNKVHDGVIPGVWNAKASQRIDVVHSFYQLSITPKVTSWVKLKVLLVCQLWVHSKHLAQVPAILVEISIAVHFNQLQAETPGVDPEVGASSAAV